MRRTSSSSEKQSAIPTSEERSEILLCFYDTYTYYYIYKIYYLSVAAAPHL
jgi:hypothetical protein